MYKPKITNYEEALAAVKKHGWAIRYVPEELKTQELYLELVKQEPSALIEDIPGKFITAELCLEAVKQNAEALEYVPEELREEVRRRLEGGE